jgi:hypothetical protein
MTSPIKNANEEAVLGEIETRKTTDPRKDSVCWCPYCEADVKALALSKLTPCYCTDFDYTPILRTEEHPRIQEAVSTALERVAAQPKHRHTSSEGPPGGPRVVNFIAQEGENLLEGIMESSGNPCTCARCRSDALAYSLNRYPPRYGVQRNGERSLPEKERAAIRIELATIMARAARMISDKPRHAGTAGN